MIDHDYVRNPAMAAAVYGPKIDADTIVRCSGTINLKGDKIGENQGKTWATLARQMVEFVVGFVDSFHWKKQYLLQFERQS